MTQHYTAKAQADDLADALDEIEKLRIELELAQMRTEAAENELQRFRHAAQQALCRHADEA